jgi:lipopolysaccharide/colanic/teichoic acid biosynthesis glycosyltransferase
MERLITVLGRIVAVFALIAAAPLLALIVLAIVCDDGAPIIFRQIRVGRHGRHFLIWKFRTMRSELYPRVRLTCAGDQRITRIGRALRKYKLDELPQLWNIVRGEMSWIGPRPEVPEFVNLDDPLWKKVLLLRPGLADAATFAFRNEEHLLAAAPDPEEYYRREILPRKLRMSIEQSRRRCSPQ